MYTLLELKSKTLGELKQIGYDLNVFPESDRRYRQNWIDALVNVNPPLLQLLEDSPAASVDPVSEAIEVQAQEPPLESKFGRIVYPRPTKEAIASAVTLLDAGVDRAQEAIALVPQNFTHFRSDSDLNPILTNADAWNPSDFGEVPHAVEPSGQLNLLEWNVNEPPDPDDYEGDIFAFHAAYDRWLLSNELNEIIHPKNDATTGTVGARATSVPPGRNFSAKHDGASSDRQDKRLAVQKGDRLLEGKGADSGGAGRVVSCQPAQLAPQAPARQAEKFPEFKIGMLVGRRSDRQHIGKILNIYQSRRGIWRAKIQPLNKSNFVYCDCAALVEQRLLYDYEMGPGGFVRVGEIFNKARCENFEVFSRKVSPKPTSWTAGELSSLSTFKLKQIARDMEIPLIPGTVGKRSTIRAILAEQAISQEKLAAQRERETGRAIVQKRKSASAAGKKNREAASPLVRTQLLLFDEAV